MHHYKFIVNGEWKFSPDDPTDEQGNINNMYHSEKFRNISEQKYFKLE